MNNHSKRLIEQVLHALRQYEEGLIEERKLLLDIEGISGAVEEEEIRNLLSGLALRIDESRHLYDVEEGKVFLSSKIAKFKKAIQVEGNK